MARVEWWPQLFSRVDYKRRVRAAQEGTATRVASAAPWSRQAQFPVLRTMLAPPLLCYLLGRPAVIFQCCCVAAVACGGGRAVSLSLPTHQPEPELTRCLLSTRVLPRGIAAMAIAHAGTISTMSLQFDTDVPPHVRRVYILSGYRPLMASDSSFIVAAAKGVFTATHLHCRSTGSRRRTCPQQA